jgi:trigger factor
MVEWINMKITRKNTSKTRVELTITLNNTELTHAEEVALVQLGEKVKIPGFRPGKVPIALVKKHVSSEELNAQTLNVAINRAVPDAYNSEKLQVLDRPEVEVKKFVPNQELEFTAEVDILPAVKLKEYKKLQATKPKVTVAEKDIDEVVERMRQGFAEKKEVVRVAK